MDTRRQIRKLQRLFEKEDSSTSPKRESYTLQRKVILTRFPSLNEHPLVLHMESVDKNTKRKRVVTRSMKKISSVEEEKKEDHPKKKSKFAMPSRDERIKSVLSLWTGMEPYIAPKKIIEPPKPIETIPQWSYRIGIGPWTRMMGVFNTDTEEIFQKCKEDKAVPYFSNIHTYVGYTVNPVSMKLITSCSWGSALSTTYYLQREMIPKDQYNVVVVDWNEKYSKWLNLSYVSQVEDSFMSVINRDGPVYKTTDLKPTCNEYTFILDFFKNHQKFGRYIPKRIRRVSHPIQARRYMFERELMDDKTEALLVHGSKTSEDNVLSNNLDMRFSGDGNCGRAIYLSNNIEYSNRYSADRKMYIVRTLIGKVDNHASAHRRVVSPKKDCDSVCHYQPNPEYSEQTVDIFSIYNNAQCYITHVVDY
ncbi:MAG: hypothetical protein PHG66_04865 [Candidatus Colwellbacteria bacterium]|nr:hypothetical protein [Candidatus Colwellbacteria bacterium]